jgi:hypothetical protein
MNEDILSPTILPNETESFVGFVQLHSPDAFHDVTGDLRRSGSALVAGATCGWVGHLFIVKTAPPRLTVVVFIAAHSTSVRD